MSWWKDYFNTVDSLKIDDIKSWFADDIALQFANTPINGRDAAIAAIGGFIGQLKTMKHKISDVLEIDDKIFVDAVVTYDLQDGRSVSIPAGTFMQRNGQQISKLKVYIDLAPLFAA